MALPAFAAQRRAAAPCYCSPVVGDRTVSKLLLPSAAGGFAAERRRMQQISIDSCGRRAAGAGAHAANAGSALEPTKDAQLVSCYFRLELITPIIWLF